MKSKPQKKSRVKLLTFNMQVGIRTQNYGQYLRRSWRHVLPPAHPTRHLDSLVRILEGHDIVAIQEADAGSYRTRSINLLHYMAERAGYPHWHLHNHRSLAPIARHGMGIMSQFEIMAHETHSLPGRVPGRAMVIYRFGGKGTDELAVVVTHLSLGERDRRRQMSHIHDQLGDTRHVILMGDLNCELDELRRHPLFRDRGFLHHPETSATHPSWQPDRLLDHILVTPEIRILDGGPMAFVWSDHLPVAMEVELPAGLQMA